MTVMSQEEARLRALRALSVVDTAPEREFDEISRSAAELCRTPTAGIAFFDASSQWFKSRVGNGLPRRIERALSPWTEIVLSGSELVVGDAASDSRFQNSPFVKPEGGLKAFAMVPLRDDAGLVLGCLCAVEHAPRAFDDRDLASLRTLARQVIALLRIRQERLQLEEVVEASGDFVLIFDSSNRLSYVSPSIIRSLQLGPGVKVGMALEEVPVPAAWVRRVEGQLAEARRSGERGRFDLRMNWNGKERLFDCLASPQGAAASGHVVLTVRDRTDRFQAELALEESSRLFRSLAEVATDCVYTKDLEGRYTYINRAGATAFARPAAEIIGRDDWALFPLHEAISIIAVDQRVLQTGENTSYEDVLVSNGKPRVWLSTKGLLKDAAGTVTGVFGISKDITERKSLEDASRVSAERLKLALQAADLGNWEYLPSSEEVYWTDPGNEHTLAPSERHGSLETYLSEVHPEDRERVRGELRRLAQTAHSYLIEYRVMRGEKVRWYQSWGLGLPNAYGPARMVGVVADVTDRKAAELERTRLLEAEQAARREADQATAELVVLDRAGGALVAAQLDERVRAQLAAQLCVPEVAAAALVILRGHRDPFVAAEPPEAAPLANWGPLRGWIGELLDGTGEAGAADPRVLPPTHACGVGIPLIADGEAFGVMVVLGGPDAFSGRKLRQVQELARRSALAIDNARRFQREHAAVAARDEVVAIVSHDLKNPLHAVQLLADRASVYAPQGPSGDALRDIHSKILDGAVRMNALIEGLLEVTSIEAGQLPLSIGSSAPERLQRTAAELLAPLARQKGVELQTETLADVPRVECDEERVLQVFSNLVGNAIKFTPAGGKVTLRARTLDGAVCFEVADTGPGIPTESLQFIFDRFFQSKRTRRADVGLGLAITRGIVEAHGGKIWVESRPGEGAHFFFTLPAAPPRIPVDGSLAAEALGAAEGPSPAATPMVARSLLTH